LNATLTKWMNHWRIALTDWSVFALDMANHPRDRLSTHCFVIELELRANPPSVAQSFRMVGGEVMSRERVHQEVFVDLGMTPKQISSWKDDVRGDDTVQVVIIAEGMLRLFWFSLRDAAKRSQGNADEKTVSKALAEDWESSLMVAIERGDDTGSRRYLEKVTAKALLGSRT